MGNFGLRMKPFYSMKGWGLDEDLRMKHCYSTEIDPLKQNLIVVNTDVEHIYISIDLAKKAVTHNLDDVLETRSSGLPPCIRVAGYSSLIGNLDLRMKHCYCTKIDPMKQNLIVVNIDVKHKTHLHLHQPNSQDPDPRPQ